MRRASPGSQRPRLAAVHVHALEVNPADDALFIATHTGMFRIPAGGDEAARVGDSYQDTMGFTIVGAIVSWVGAPRPARRSAPYLGLIESDDAGEEWDAVSLLGRADFHVPRRLVVGSTVRSDFKTRKEQFLISQDDGGSWNASPFPSRCSHCISRRTRSAPVSGPGRFTDRLTQGELAASLRRAGLSAGLTPGSTW